MANRVTSVGVAPYYDGLSEELLRGYNPNFTRTVMDPVFSDIQQYYLFEERFNSHPAPHLIFLVQSDSIGLLAAFTSRQHELNQQVSLALENHLGTKFLDPSRELLDYFSPGLILNGVFFEEAVKLGFEKATERIRELKSIPLN